MLYTIIRFEREPFCSVQGCLCSLSRIPDLIHLTGNGGHQFISIATPLVQGVCGMAHLVACVFQAYSQCENHSVKILFP